MVWVWESVVLVPGLVVWVPGPLVAQCLWYRKGRPLHYHCPHIVCGREGWVGGGAAYVVSQWGCVYSLSD